MYPFASRGILNLVFSTLQIKAVEKQRKSSGFAAFIGPLQSRLFFSIRPMQTIYECNNYIR